jgi:hypothetical protein
MPGAEPHRTEADHHVAAADGRRGRAAGAVHVAGGQRRDDAIAPRVA